MKKIILFLIAATIIFFGVMHFEIHNYLTLSALREQQAQLQTAISENTLLYASGYFAIYLLVATLSIPGALILTLAGGALFGFFLGTILVSFASSIGALMAFLVARYFLRDAVEKRFSSQLKTVNEKIKKEGANYLLFLRLVPIFPFFFVNLVMSLTAIRPSVYYIFSQIGMFPSTLVYINAGTQIAKIESLKDITSPSILFAFVLLGIFPFIAKAIAVFIRARKAYGQFNKPKSFDYNTVVLGGGSAGLVAAYTTSTLQGKVALIERHKMGGDCLNTGCVPSKAILRSAKFIADLKRPQALGVKSANYEVLFHEVMTRVHSKISTIQPKDSVKRYTELGVDCHQGDAKVLSPWQVEVNGKILSTKNIIIATGATPWVPAIPGIEHTHYLTTDTIWALKELPKHLVIIGAGPIGCELGQAFARLGAKVSLIQRNSVILPNEDHEAAEVLEKSLLIDGIAIYKNFITEKFSSKDKTHTLHGSHAGEITRIDCSHVLVATGRRANLTGLEALNLDVGSNGRLTINQTLQTRFPNVYACGDVTSPKQYTHVASHQAWYAAFNALFSPIKKFKCSLDNVPYAVFTDPEIAGVGITEQEAIENNTPYKVTMFPMDDIDRAITDNATEGFVKVLTPHNSDKILGVTMVGDHASELISEFVLAKTHKMGLNKILGTVHIYPTKSEINRMVAGKWKRTQLTERVVRLLKKYQRWRLGN
jgi:pyruvate/2-oxoglutarate dehydrogenase complex dihydrolipoamide dehydrogenase (E3) component/uncharacterized membrane protein YdjX (TVP38/TMEM64 family)